VRLLILAFSGLIVSLGCKSNPPSKLEAHDLLHEREIYASLKDEPVPVPSSTAYDASARQRQSFIDGFQTGWDLAISGALLHGTFGTPVDLPADIREAWTAGWKSGTKLGSDRWLAESRKGFARKDGGANGSQP
jgi:hypothetical protein